MRHALTRFIARLLATCALLGMGAAHAALTNYGGTWWNPSESGWGINFAHQGNTIFASWFTYDATGKSWWLVMPSATETTPNVFTGTLYQTSGSPYNVPFNSSAVTVTVVGAGTLTFTSATTGSFAYMVNGISQAKSIARQVYSSPVPTCVWDAQPNPALAINFQDTWWNPSESGWIAHFAHQGDIIFATLFIYDLDGSGIFLVATNAASTGSGVYSGALYRTIGPAFSASPWTAVSVTMVGSMTITFASGNTATLAYSVNGVSVTKAITRQVFNGHGTVCGFVPAAPTIGTAAPGAAQATVSFTAPASDGGLPITSYMVTASPGGITSSGPASPIAVTGLASGTAYTFTVTATNAVGTGAASSPSGSATPAVPPQPASADFNADGHPDILWSNTAYGATFLWYMNGPEFSSDAFVTQIDPSWKIQGVADFNGDGHPDLVWRNTATGSTYVWYMNGPSFVSDALLFSLPPEWVIQGVADFNGDGKPDFLMRNTNTGVAFVWFFNDNVAIGDQFLFGIDPMWKVEAVADLDNDGQPDLLFRSMTSGLAFAWNTQYGAGTLSLGASSAPIFGIDPVWEIVQMADWNGDGRPDLLFRNRDSGLVFVWYMTGTTLQGSDFVTQIDPSWEIVPRR